MVVSIIETMKALIKLTYSFMKRYYNFFNVGYFHLQLCNT